MKRYELREKMPESTHLALGEYPELLRTLLHGRGITNSAEASAFLKPDYIAQSHDPFLLAGMEHAVERILKAKRDDELVCVWSDYDADGIPGGVMLTEFLRAVGIRVRHYIPHRHTEGYGLNMDGLDELAKEGTKLVITIDLGTTEHECIAHANSKGMDVIVCDHHLPPETLPDALAILNPYRKGSAYPFEHLCGAGVAWKLVQGILARDRSVMPEGKEKWLLDLVGLATLSDMVPLTGENRMLASYGLLVMRRNRRPGLSALLKMLRINARTLSEDDVTFMVTPRINAASRMAKPETAARLLGTMDTEEADALARELNTINDERKGVVAAITKEAKHRLSERAVPSGIIVMGSPKWRPGVLGLVANSLMEQEGVPVFLWGREGGETLKGSCRSPNVSVVEIMRAAGDLFDDFGGHELSGGFALKEEKEFELSERLAQAYEAARSATSDAKPVFLDAELALEDASRSLREISLLAPFGEGNRKPLFLFPGAEIAGMKSFGKTKNHLELSLARGGSRIAGISFFTQGENFTKPPQEGARADIVGHLELDFRNRPRLRVIDLL